jgi:histidinol phosphatase-like enzyme
MKVIFVDIDETICDTPESRDYHASTPKKNIIEKVNRLYDEGHKIVYWTARGSRSGIDWHEHTEQQLNNWGVKYHELHCDKPYYDIFYDDKAFNIEEL